MATRRHAPAEPQQAQLNVDQMRRGVSRIQKRIAELEAFDAASVSQRWSPEVKALQTAIDETLADVFGHGTVDYNRYLAAASLDRGPIMHGPPNLIAIRQYVARGKRESIALLTQAVRGLEEKIAESQESASAIEARHEAEPRDQSKVFVVHGRDGEAMNEVARFLAQIGLEPIILHEKPNRGRHLLTKFQEEATGVGFAVVLMTPDDEGALVGDHPYKRARQNVVFELGFLIGELGSSRVAALVKGEIERPSDFDGVGYIPFDAAGGWKGLLARELKAVGMPFDPAKVFDA